MDQWLDWPAFGFLALLTLLDGLRQVPAGALVLRKTLGGSWRVVSPGVGYRIVSWWPPVTTTLILAPAQDRSSGQAARRSNRQEESLRGVRRRAAVLQLLGLLSLLALVVVVPVAMRWWGGLGFLSSLFAVLVLSWLVTGLSFYFSNSLELTTRQRIMFALPRLNPFASPAAGEALLERALNGGDPLAVAKLLMEEEEFAAWVRPQAYDVAEGIDTDQGRELVRVVGRNELITLISSRPVGIPANTPWCPRCGSEFAPTSTECPACEIPLKS